MGCFFQITSNCFGSIKRANQVGVRELKGEELILEGLSRGLEVNDDLCRIIEAEIPPLEWQRDMIQWFAELSIDSRSAVHDYTGDGYEEMNGQLRNDPSSYAELNDIIEEAPPLPRDVIVYRSVGGDYLPATGDYTCHGYFSTTCSAWHVVRDICIERRTKQRDKYMISMLVPRGTRCLYIPSSEYELIFPHGSVMAITARYLHKTPCTPDNLLKTNVWMHEVTLV